MSDTAASDSSPAPSGSGEASRIEDSADFLGLLLVLARRKKLILWLTVGAAVVSAAVAMLLPFVYTGVARILPPQQLQGSVASALLSQLGGLSLLAGGGLGIRNAADLYTGMLKSETVADALIARFDLQSVYDEKTRFDTRNTLRKRTLLVPGRDGIITVEVEDRDPKRAAELANAYVEELRKLTATLAITEAAQRRVFFEKQLKSARDDLAGAEIALRDTQQETGVIKLDDQGRAIIENIARLRGMLTAKEIQLSAMRTFSTEQNPDYRRVVEETATLRGQLARLEKDSGKGDKGDIFVPTGRVPESGLKYLRRVRDVKYYETIFELLARQYEIAKIDEARDTSQVQVIDRAAAPDKRTRPRRAVIVLVSTTLALLVAVMAAWVLESLERAKRDPGRAGRLESIRDSLRAW